MSIIWGLILAIAAQGFYDVLSAAIRSQIQDAAAYGITCGVVVLFLFVLFRKTLYPKNAQLDLNQPKR